MKNTISNTLLLITLLGVFALGCKKEASIPTVTTSGVTEITQNTAVSSCMLADDGGASITSQGICWSTRPDPTVNDSKSDKLIIITSFSIRADGLTANTPYYLRAYATNSAGTGYGNTVTFTTLSATLPVVKNVLPSSVAQTTAQLGGEVTSDGGAPITARGVCWGTSTDPTVSGSKAAEGAGLGSFTGSLEGLTPSTTYYLRVYATNIAGTAYGATMEMRTLHSTVTDIDGNIYNTVIIGTQEWMVENLKVTRYRNGDPIANITDNAQWRGNSTIGAWCSYNNDPANKVAYGLLYNFYTVADSRGICPAGWHVPSDAEWTALTDYLGGEAFAGSKMKSAGLDSDANNSSGFSALMGGNRLDYDGQYVNLKYEGYWWSSTATTSINAWSRYLTLTVKKIRSEGNLKWAGCYIRCVKD